MTRCSQGPAAKCPQHPPCVPRGGSGVSRASPKVDGTTSVRVGNGGVRWEYVSPSDATIPLGSDKCLCRRLCFCRKAGSFLMFLVGSPTEMHLSSPRSCHTMLASTGQSPVAKPAPCLPFKQCHILHVHVCYHLPLPGDDLGPAVLQRNPIKDVA